MLLPCPGTAIGAVAAEEDLTPALKVFFFACRPEVRVHAPVVEPQGRNSLYVVPEHVTLSHQQRKREGGPPDQGRRGVEW